MVLAGTDIMGHVTLEQDGVWTQAAEAGHLDAVVWVLLTVECTELSSGHEEVAALFLYFLAISDHSDVVFMARCCPGVVLSLVEVLDTVSDLIWDLVVWWRSQWSAISITWIQVVLSSYV